MPMLASLGVSRAAIIAGTFNVLADTTAPVLSSASSTVTGQTTATVRVTTDTPEGTLYAVVTASMTAPTAAQIIAGSDNNGAAAVFDDVVAIEEAGEATFAATGLLAGTGYYAHFTHEDVAGNRSAVVSSALFTTQAPPVDVDTTYLGALTVDTSVSTRARVTDVALRKGPNALFFRMNGSNQSQKMTCTVDGEVFTPAFANDGTQGVGNWIWFIFERDAEGTASIVDFEAVGDVLSSGIKVWHLAAAGAKIVPADTEFLFTASHSAGATFGTKAFAPAAGDQTISAVLSTGSISVAEGDLLGQDGSFNYFVGRKTAGPIRMSTGASRNVSFSTILLKKVTGFQFSAPVLTKTSAVGNPLKVAVQFDDGAKNALNLLIQDRRYRHPDPTTPLVADGTVKYGVRYLTVADFRDDDGDGNPDHEGFPSLANQPSEHTGYQQRLVVEDPDEPAGPNGEPGGFRGVSDWSNTVDEIITSLPSTTFDDQKIGPNITLSADKLTATTELRNSKVVKIVRLSTSRTGDRYFRFIAEQVFASSDFAFGFVNESAASDTSVDSATMSGIGTYMTGQGNVYVDGDDFGNALTANIVSGDTIDIRMLRDDGSPELAGRAGWYVRKNAEAWFPSDPDLAPGDTGYTAGVPLPPEAAQRPFVGLSREPDGVNIASFDPTGGDGTFNANSKAWDEA